MPIVFTVEELASRIGERPSALVEWQQLGLLNASPLGPRELELARLIQFLVRQGIPPARIAEAHDEVAIARYLSSLFPSGADDCCTLDEAVRRTGMPREVIARLAGLSFRLIENAPPNRRDLQ